MSVWIVIYEVFYGDTEVLGVCLSEERAMIYRDEYIKTVLGDEWNRKKDRTITITEMIVTE